MVLAIVIFLILQQINASSEFISETFTKIDNATIDSIVRSGTFSKWNELGLSVRAPLITMMFFEILIEVVLVAKWIPKFFARQFRKITKRGELNMERIKSIEYKLNKGYRLTRSEQRFIRKNKVRGDNHVS